MLVKRDKEFSSDLGINPNAHNDDDNDAVEICIMLNLESIVAFMGPTYKYKLWILLRHKSNLKFTRAPLLFSQNY